jgi:hypothetical protein
MNSPNEILETFNVTFKDFIQYAIDVIKDNKDIKDAKIYFNLLLNKKNSIIKIWYNYVYMPYKEYIDKGDMIYFLNKDYNDDLNIIDEKNKSNVIDIINKLREPIKKMNETDYNNSCLYIKKLSQLSNLYVCHSS